MMSNPKTTILGYLSLLAVLIHAAQAVISGNYANVGIPDIIAALTGVGLIASKDGGH